MGSSKKDLRTFQSHYLYLRQLKKCDLNQKAIFKTKCYWTDRTSCPPTICTAGTCVRRQAYLQVRTSYSCNIVLFCFQRIYNSCPRRVSPQGFRDATETWTYPYRALFTLHCKHTYVHPPPHSECRVEWVGRIHFSLYSEN